MKCLRCSTFPTLLVVSLALLCGPAIAKDTKEFASHQASPAERRLVASPAQIDE